MVAGKRGLHKKRGDEKWGGGCVRKNGNTLGKGVRVHTSNKEEAILGHGLHFRWEDGKTPAVHRPTKSDQMPTTRIWPGPCHRRAIKKIRLRKIATYDL